MLLLKYPNQSYYRGHIKRAACVSCVSYIFDILRITYTTGLVYLWCLDTNICIDFRKPDGTRSIDIRSTDRQATHITQLMMKALYCGEMCRFLPRIKKDYVLKHRCDRTYTLIKRPGRVVKNEF